MRRHKIELSTASYFSQRAQIAKDISRGFLLTYPDFSLFMELARIIADRNLIRCSYISKLRDSATKPNHATMDEEFEKACWDAYLNQFEWEVIIELNDQQIIERDKDMTVLMSINANISCARTLISYVSNHPGDVRASKIHLLAMDYARRAAKSFNPPLESFCLAFWQLVSLERVLHSIPDDVLKSIDKAAIVRESEECHLIQNADGYFAARRLTF